MARMCSRVSCSPHNIQEAGVGGGMETGFSQSPLKAQSSQLTMSHKAPCLKSLCGAHPRTEYMGISGDVQDQDYSAKIFFKFEINSPE